MTQGYPADGLQSTQSASEVCLCGGHRSFFWLHLTTFLSSNHITFSTLTASLPTTWDSGMNDSALGLLLEGLLSAFCPESGKASECPQAEFTIAGFSSGESTAASICRHKPVLACFLLTLTCPAVDTKSGPKKEVVLPSWRAACTAMQ